ncbi:hypothetical protein LIER_41656 [Lithospermum erythrorhizon]|uniref:Uncharacterized protein n=1 Tax=Lithospermum erythrorhizon TaxID=34254 RepID=A0AAV3RCI5_LITER
MDPETLAFIRLYTAVGAEFTIGDLKFTKDHDPLANLAIPQDVAYTVAGKLNDADVEENPQNSEVFSVEPLAVRRPYSTTIGSPSIQPTPTPSQATGNAPADANAKKTSDAPTIIDDSLPVSFSEEDLVNFRQYFSIPPSVEMRLPLEGEWVFEQIVDPSKSEGTLAPGWTAMYIESLSYGAHFPFLPFIDELLVAVNRAPGQIHEVLAAAARCVEPKEVPFSTMIGNRIPLFRGSGLNKKFAKDYETSGKKVPRPAVVVTSTAVMEKRSVAF